MDLRPHLAGTIDRAKEVLNYQPFILSDDVQTGAAYSWVSARDPRVSPPLVFDRADMTVAEWERTTDANRRLRKMYDDQLDEVARRFPGGSLLDVACNNGYFPVGAELRGMQGTGMDYYDYSQSVSFLNKTLKTNAKFIHAAYDSRAHKLPLRKEFDVTVVSAIMCHLPDPLNFLRAVSGVTKGALLFWGQMVNSRALIVSYQAPHRDLSELKDFPYSFNDNTRISRALFDLAMAQLGFREVVEISPRDGWLEELHAPRSASLEEELLSGSQHHAILAIR
ncbi:MAG: class I SAM-dependent methyltransferase [Beijerinckiaceae bacterium]